MGFTRYYTVNSKLDSLKFKDFSLDCQLVCEWITKTTGEEIAGFDGTGESAFSEKNIIFNGLGSESHETFSLSVDTFGFNFTKTNLKPYDKHVFACLVLAKFYFKDSIEVSGDGEDDDYPEISAVIKSFLRDRKILEILN